jgi:vancomycin resistance protein YoaR
MTTATPDSIAIGTEPLRPSRRLRFLVAFLVGLLAAMAVGAGALYAYDLNYAGRVLPGVRVGPVDLSGLDATAAAGQLRAAYGGLGTGEIVVKGPEGSRSISYTDIGRGPDIAAMVADAMAIGRSGNPVDRVVGNARTAWRGVTLPPRVTIDAQALATRISAYAATLAADPVEASVRLTDNQGYEVQAGSSGRLADPTAAIAAAFQQAGALDAPPRLEFDLPVTTVEPHVTTAEAAQAKDDAERLSAPIELKVAKEAFMITGASLRSWITFGPLAGRSYGPTLDTTGLAATVTKLAKRIDRTAVNASFTTRGGAISGVTPSRDGQKMNVTATTRQIQALIAARVAGATTSSITPAVRITEPALTTAEAAAARPRMRMISQWKTIFYLSEKNGFGANIWVPSRLIDGYVVAPGATFDFWDAVGPVSRAKGFRQGGAIINGRTEPQGALAGGICSCSTTLFNAALRAGFQMGARRNHFYYIDRYPLGLDATVFISASGAKQTMSWTNDTQYPVLIRGYQIRAGGTGWVKFALFSVPTGRRVSFATSRRRNLRYASDIVQYASTLAPGVRQRVEYPVDGFNVTAVRTVRDRHGKVIHHDVYYSNYARITGIVLVGR